MISKFKKILPANLKSDLKQRLLNAINVPWNKFGMPMCLMNHLSGKRNITLIDIGASSGQFTDLMNEAFGVANAMLIEPQPARYADLIKKYEGRGYEIACAALADSEGTVDMEILQWDQSSSILPVKRDRPEVNSVIDLETREVIKCRSTRLDTICKERAFEGSVDIIKLDVQGAEHLVLSGASETLKRASLLWTEVSFQALYQGSSTIEGIIAQCRNNGFVLHSLVEAFRASNSELLQADALFVKA